MRALTFDRSRLAQSALVSALTLAALALLAWILARWTWVWFAPAAEPEAAVVVAAGEGGTRARELFGHAAPADAGGALPALQAAGIRLLGVVAATGAANGHALLQLDGQPIVSVREGADIAPGLRLVEVQPRQVVVERGGSRETLSLPPPGVSAPAPAPAIVP